MNPFYHFKRMGRILLFGLTMVEFIKCLVLPNTLDVLIFVGLLLLFVSVLIEMKKPLARGFSFPLLQVSLINLEKPLTNL